MILIWHRPYWDHPIVDEVKSFEYTETARMIAFPEGDRLTIDRSWVITNMDGKRETFSAEFVEHLIIMNEFKGDDFRVIL